MKFLTKAAGGYLGSRFERLVHQHRDIMAANLEAAGPIAAAVSKQRAIEAGTQLMLPFSIQRETVAHRNDAISITLSILT